MRTSKHTFEACYGRRHCADCPRARFDEEENLRHVCNCPCHQPSLFVELQVQRRQTDLDLFAGKK